MESQPESCIAELKKFIAEAAELVTPAVAEVLKACACRHLCSLRVPAKCPQALDGKVCQVRRRGSASSRLLIAAQGCFRVVAERYKCQTHDRKWLLPTGDSTTGCNIVADAVGDYLVDRDWWPTAINIFTETESVVAVERHMRRITATALAASFSQQRVQHALSQVELALLPCSPGLRSG